MLLALLTFSGDIQAAQNLLDWIGELGGCQNHALVIVADAGTPFDEASAALELGRKSFRSAKLVANDKSVMGWPDGSWSLFQTAINFAREPFLILEPDAIPLKSGWLDAIELLYSRLQPDAFLGHIYDCKQAFMPERLMSGIAVYPANMRELLPPAPSPQAWDVYSAEIMVVNGIDTSLIRHLWGTKELSPFFVRNRHERSPVNALALDSIPTDCVLWHRDKSQSLIRLLRAKPVEKITVCFPVHSGDINLAVMHAAWLCKMGRRHQHKAIICHDPSCNVLALNQLEQHLRRIFADVETFVYSRPPLTGYPQAANFAFQSIALHMAKQKSPWFFFEADTVALKPDWVEQLQEEYETAGMSWMGPHVKGMHHANGCMIYPADAAQRMPVAMQCSNQAWDYFAAAEYMNDCHDASRLMHHVWTILNGRLCEVGGGELPLNASLELLNQIPPTAVVSHRWKDDSVLRQLMSGAFRL